MDVKFSISELKKKAMDQPFYFDKTVDVTELEKLNNDIRKIEHVKVQGNCYFKNEEIIFSLKIIGTLILPCARTLVDVPYSFNIQATEIFTTSNYLSEEDEENEVHQVDGEVLDLLPVIKENILL